MTSLPPMSGIVGSPTPRKPEPSTECAGWLVADSEQRFRVCVADIAELPFAFDDPKALRKALRFIGANEGLPELEPAFVITLEQAVQEVVLARRQRNEEKRQARERKGFVLAQRNKARRFQERGR